MQCITPMFRLYDISTGETKRIISRAEVMQNLELNPNNIRWQLSKMNAHYLTKNMLVQTIPCKNCWACNLNYSAEWATRNMLETLEHDHNYFITLTYDEEHLPIPETMSYKEVYEMDTHNIEVPVTIENDGTWIDGTLYPDHVKRFINSIRKHFERQGIYNIRYFYCGEYGSETQRPHYHMLLYGVPMDLSQNYSWHIDKNHKEHWKNPLIDKYWPYGMHDIANIEWSSAAYVSRYCTKKLNFEPRSDKWYAEQGKLKEFIRMSRMPGIGMNYYKMHKLDIYSNDEMIMKTVKGNTGSFKPPKAFDKLFKEEYPEEYERIENHRKECAERSRHNSYRITDYTDLEQITMKAKNIITKGNMLKREFDGIIE